MEPTEDPSYGVDGSEIYSNLHDTYKKGKLYLSVTVPKHLRHLFSDKQIRRSTGTSDKRVANERADKIYNEILDRLNKAAEKLDPFIEGVRPYLEKGGVDVSK